MKNLNITKPKKYLVFLFDDIDDSIVKKRVGFCKGHTANILGPVGAIR